MKRDEQAAGLREFARTYFQLAVTIEEAREVLDVLGLGCYSSQDLPELIRKLRLRH